MIVEDGTGLPNADSYVSIEFADSYFSARGVTDWTALTQAKKEVALICATDYIDNVFQWYGKKQFEGQSLRFPRVNIKDYEGEDIVGVPNCLKQAVCDTALMSANGTTLFQTQNENGDVVSENITQLSFTYSKSEKSTTSKTLYDAINTKLRGLFKDSGNAQIVSGKVERV